MRRLVVEIPSFCLPRLHGLGRYPDDFSVSTIAPHFDKLPRYVSYIGSMSLQRGVKLGISSMRSVHALLRLLDVAEITQRAAVEADPTTSHMQASSIARDHESFTAYLAGLSDSRSDRGKSLSRASQCFAKKYIPRHSANTPATTRRIECSGLHVFDSKCCYNRTSREHV